MLVAACPMFVAHTHAAVSAVAAAEQQPEGWRFVPDTILPGKAVGGPNTVQHSSTVQKHTKQDGISHTRLKESLYATQQAVDNPQGMDRPIT